MEKENSMEKSDDLDLVRKFKKGDEKAFNPLVRKHQQGIYRLCYGMLRNADDAADVCQDVFVKAYLSMRRFREKSSVYTWLYRIAVNTCIDFASKRPRWELANPEGDMVNPEEGLRRGKVRRAIDHAVSKLPPKQRAVFVMRQYEGMSYQDIAELTRRSVGALKANYHHAVFKLRELLKEYSG